MQHVYKVMHCMEFTGRLCVYFCRQAAPIAGGQKPGTSGLRAKTATFMSKGYLANFLQATLDSLEGVRNGVLVLGGDGPHSHSHSIRARHNSLSLARRYLIVQAGR